MIYNKIKNKLANVEKRIEMALHPELYIKKDDEYAFQHEIFSRTSLQFQNIEALSEIIPQRLINCIAIDFKEPNYYGAYSALKKYAQLDSFILPPKNLGIQHGYVFEMHTWEKSKLEMRNLVWSKKLVDMYHELTDNPQIFAIGAPFFYAESLLSKNQIASEKYRLGKNLLAFPMHSSACCDTNFDPNKFLSILEEEKRRFDTVRVCLYWKDIIRGVHKVYLENGFECVCNGHMYDTNFLGRQKSLFEIADATISNGIGSHVGYSIFMEKPHRLIDDYYEYKGGDGTQLTDMMTKDNFKRVEKAFLEPDDYVITPQQRSIVDEFWGLSDLKTREELRKLIIKLYGDN